VSVDSSTLTRFGGAVVVFFSTATGYVVARWNTRTQIRVARLQIEAAVERDEEQRAADARDRSAALVATAKSESERLVEERAARVDARIESLVQAQEESYAALRTEHLTLRADYDAMRQRLWKVEEENRTQRRDMDAIAREKDVLNAKVAEQVDRLAEQADRIAQQADRIADLETNDRLKTGWLARMQLRMAVALDYITTLSQQIIGLGHVPHPPPHDLHPDSTTKERS
jgi:chromosome segregation ATPase